MNLAQPSGKSQREPVKLRLCWHTCRKALAWPYFSFWAVISSFSSPFTEEENIGKEIMRLLTSKVSSWKMPVILFSLFFLKHFLSKAVDYKLYGVVEYKWKKVPWSEKPDFNNCVISKPHYGGKKPRQPKNISSTTFNYNVVFKTFRDGELLGVRPWQVARGWQKGCGPLTPPHLYGHLEASCSQHAPRALRTREME